MIVTVTPNPSLDRTLELPSVRWGEVNRATDRHVEPSGKGVNVTRALAVNGVPSLAVLPLGGAEGGQLRALLEDEGIHYAAVPVRASVRVNVSVVTPGGVATKLNEPGPVLDADEVAALEDAAGRQAAGASWVVAAGSLSRGMPPDQYARLVRRAHAAGAHVALDSSGDALRGGLAGSPELVKPNREELAELTGRWPRTLGEVVAAAREVCATTGGMVLVSLGADGAVLVDGASAVHAESPIESPRSPIGAGDNLLAGYLSALERHDGTAGLDSSERNATGSRLATHTTALREAVAWSAVAVRAPGSLGRPVTEVDRRAVRVHASIEADHPLRCPPADGRD